MNPEEKAALKHIAKVSEENNLMLRRIQRNARFATFFVIVKWTILLGIAIGAFYYLQPVVQKVDEIYSTVTNSHLPGFLNFFKN